MESASAQARASSDHFAVGALACGLAALLLGFLPAVVFLGWLLAILAILFGVVGRNSARRAMAICGIGLGAVVLLTGLVALTLAVVGQVSTNRDGSSYDDTTPSTR